MKTVARTLKDLPNSDIYCRIIDGSDRVDDIIEDLKNHWSYDLYSRRPGPAVLENGALKPTDLDLACFLSALADRNAVIVLPTYAARRPVQTKANERVVSKENRHGHVTGLVSNKDVFSFSVRIVDANVITSDAETGTDVVGAPRSFMLVDLNGAWHDGWKSIEFVPSRKENQFLEDRELWTDKTIYFKNFIHPNRWTSFYGQWYVITKILIERLRDEVKHCNAEAKRISASFAMSGDASSEDGERESVTTGPSKKIIVTAFEAEVDHDTVSAFRTYPSTVAGAAEARERATKLRYVDVPALQFAVRATELAFTHKLGVTLVHPEDAPPELPATPDEPFPAWVQNAKWDHEYKIKRTVWNRLVLTQHVPFAPGLALRYRLRTKKEEVKA